MKENNEMNAGRERGRGEKDRKGRKEAMEEEQNNFLGRCFLSLCDQEVATQT